MKKLCQSLANWCLINSGAEESQYPILVYGLETMFNSSCKILGILILGAIFQCFRSVLVTMAVFCSMRLPAGGYHCKTHLGCFSAMCGTCFVPIMISSLDFPGVYLIRTAMLLYSGWMILRYAPRNSLVNPIQNTQILHKKKIQSILCFLVCSVLLMCCKQNTLKWLIILPLFIESFTISPVFYPKHSTLNINTCHNHPRKNKSDIGKEDESVEMQQNKRKPSTY